MHGGARHKPIENAGIRCHFRFPFYRTEPLDNNTSRVNDGGNSHRRLGPSLTMARQEHAVSDLPNAHRRRLAQIVNRQFAVPIEK